MIITIILVILIILVWYLYANDYFNYLMPSDIPEVVPSNDNIPVVNIPDVNIPEVKAPVVSVPAPSIPEVRKVNPRPARIKDCGYGHMKRGWYDFRNQGVKNDYCRHVGDHPNIWFSCQFADANGNVDASNQNTSPSMIFNPDAPHEDLISGTYGC